MKKLLVTVVCLVMMGGLMAQEEHLSFKGVPINGTLKQYTAAMVKAGFKSEGTQDGLSLLSGDFAGFKGCIVGVSTLTNCDVVNRIVVLFPEKDTWSSLMGDYEHLKSLLTTKYGEPDVVQEYFTGYAGRTDSDAIKMSALHSEELEWYTIFKTELGNIELSVVSASYGKGMVRLGYYDKKNTETVTQSALDDL